MEGASFRQSLIKTNTNPLQNRNNLKSLIIRSNNMLKKVEIDDGLGCLLDEFLKKLQQYNLFISNGIFNTNFTEAALLLQNAAELYCKKVDLLWDNIIDYQKRMVLNETHNQNDEEIRKLEERQRRYKRKRKIDTNQIQQQQNNTNELGTDFSLNLNQVTDYVNQNYEQNDLLSIWNKYADDTTDDNNCNNSRNQTALFLPEDILRDDGNEYVGRYDQFHIATIIPDLFNVDNDNDDNHNNSIKTDSGINSNNSSLPLIEETSNDSFVRLEPISESIVDKQLRRDSCFVYIEKLSTDLIDNNLRKSSFDSGFNESLSSLFDSRCLQQSFVNIERLPQSIVDDKLNKLRRIEAISRDSAFFDDFDDDNDNTSIINDNNNNNKSLCCGGSTVIKPNKNSTKNLRNINDSCGRPTKRRRISEKLIKKYSAGNTVLSRDFEGFYLDQYKPAEGEGTPVRPEFSNYEHDNASNHDDDDDDNNVDQTEFHDTSPESVSNRLEFSQIDEGFISPTISQQFNYESNQEFDDSSHNSIREWRTFILSKLKDLENRSEFDIHRYGTEIIQSSNIGETRLFKDVVVKKDSGECARYFLSTLQLANTNNIKFSDVLPGQLSNDTLKITIIDKARYHELLDDYQAPSEEVFRSRFERMQAMNPDVLLHSTPSSSSGDARPSKRPKVVKSSKKIRFT